MSHQNGFLKTGLCSLMLALVIVTAVPVYAAPVNQTLPPVPEWPIIGPLLQWLGLAPTATPTPTATPPPTPVLPEYKITSMSDLKSLEQKLTANQPSRVIITEADINALIMEALGSKHAGEVRNLAITLVQDEIKVSVEVDRQTVESYGVPLGGQAGTLKIDGTFGVAVQNCRASLKVKEIKINDRGFPLGGTAEKLLNNAIDKNWPDSVCVQQVTLTPGQLTLEGYRK